MGRGGCLLLALCGHGRDSSRSVFYVRLRGWRYADDAPASCRHGKNHGHDVAEPILHGVGADFDPRGTNVLAERRQRFSPSAVRLAALLVRTRASHRVAAHSIGIPIARLAGRAYTPTVWLRMGGQLVNK